MLCDYVNKFIQLIYIARNDPLMSLFLHVAGLNKVKETDSQKEVLNIKLITL